MTCCKPETEVPREFLAGPKVTPPAMIVPHRRLFAPYDYVLRALCFTLMTHKDQVGREWRPKSN